MYYTYVYLKPRLACTLSSTRDNKLERH